MIEGRASKNYLPRGATAKSALWSSCAVGDLVRQRLVEVWRMLDDGSRQWS
jgi:hypothetical protein